MPYNFMRELHTQWARWAEEENKCPHCGGILPWIQSPFISQSAQQMRAADGFTAEQIATIRRIARDVVSGGGE